MMTSTTHLILLGLLVVSLLVFFSCRPRLKLPPGPPGLPLLGNVLDAPKSRPWLTFKEWSRIYGSDVVHFQVLGTHIVIVNSTQAAKDLFEKQSHIYSDKLQSVMVHELTGFDRLLAFLPYGDWWRMHRRFFHQYFRPNAVPEYHGAMTKGVHKLLTLLLESPDGFLKHIRFMAGSTILGIVYGLDAQPVHDPYIRVVEEAVQIGAEVASAGTFYIVDFFPFLKHLPAWFPGAQFKRQAAQWKPTIDAMFMKPYIDTKAAYDQGTAKPSILTASLDDLDKMPCNDRNEEMIINVMGMSYAAGTDTTVSTLSSFVLAILLHTEVQATAQKELDRVIGRGRLPELKDQESLPYITAIMKEVFRWRPVLPLATPHQSVADYEYNGYHIPARSIVMGNAWAILHDEARYPDPEAFKPVRFLTSEGKLDPNVPDPIETFGFSRRICAGRYFALDSVWLAIANVLATFTVTKPVDQQGHIIEPSGEYTDGLATFPVPFKAIIKPRFAGVADLIRSADSAVAAEE